MQQSPADIFGEVFRAIWAHKLRAFLTMFGIAWGVGSMLLLIGFGEGFRSGQRRQMASLGNNVIMMWGGNIPAVPSQHTGMRPYKLTLADEAAVRAGAPAGAQHHRHAAKFDHQGSERSIEQQRRGDRGRAQLQ